MKTNLACADEFEKSLQDLLNRERMECAKDLVFLEEYAHLCKEYGRMVDADGDLAVPSDSEEILDMIKDLIERIRSKD